jgi:hypothetical protein
MIMIRGGTSTINREITARLGLAILVYDAKLAILAAVAAATTVYIGLVTIPDSVDAVRRSGLHRGLGRWYVSRQ